MKQSNRFYQSFIPEEVYLFHLNLAYNECLRPAVADEQRGTFCGSRMKNEN